jgi:glucose-6-phosphate 1-dehydrogenase
MRGEATLFTRNDEVEAQWRIIDPIVQAWSRSDEGVGQYPSGSQGPAEVDRLLVGDDVWRSI